MNIKYSISSDDSTFQPISHQSFLALLKQNTAPKCWGDIIVGSNCLYIDKGKIQFILSYNNALRSFKMPSTSSSSTH